MADIAKKQIVADAGPTMGEKLEDLYEKNQNLITWLLLAIVVAVVGWKGYQIIHERKVAKVSSEYGIILENLQRAAMSQEEKARVDALQAAITQAERVAAEHSGMYVGQMAQLLVGNAHEQLASAQKGDQAAASFKSAQTAYDKFLAINGLSSSQQAAGHLALGNVLEDQLVRNKDLKLVPQIEKAYDEASRLAKGTYIDAEARMGKARLYQNLEGQENKAIQILEEVQKEFAVELPELKEAKPYVTQAGNEITVEEQAKVLVNADLSYAEQAREMMETFRGMPAVKAATSK